MFYKYTISYETGTRLTGYAESKKTEAEVRRAIAKKFYGDFKMNLEKYGTKFPPVNSDYILTV